MQELSDSIKRTKVRIIGFKEGEEVQVTGIQNIFNKTVTENSQISRKFCPSDTGILQDTKQT
jgi:hypothetical protein